MKVLMILLVGFTFLFATLVDINNASASELTALKGVGVKKAAAIVLFRSKHCFGSVDEIVQVKGIGKKTLQKNRKSMKVGACVK